MTIPTIRIQTSGLLYNSVSDEERAKWNTGNSDPNMSMNDIEEYTDQLRSSWRLQESNILNAMTETYGVDFKKSVIDVYVSQWSKSISNPMIINPSRPPDIQIDTLAHELLHVLFTDNSLFSMHEDNQSVKLIDKWRELFGNDLDWNTLVHIPVFAGLKMVFIDVLGQPERLERDIGRYDDNPPYKAAWEYVQGNDYKVINESLRRLYLQL